MQGNKKKPWSFILRSVFNIYHRIQPLSLRITVYNIHTIFNLLLAPRSTFRITVFNIHHHIQTLSPSSTFHITVGNIRHRIQPLITTTFNIPHYCIEHLSQYSSFISTFNIPHYCIQHLSPYSSFFTTFNIPHYCIQHSSPFVTIRQIET